MKNRHHNLAHHVMMAPAMIFLVVFNVIPLLGYVMAFQKYSPVNDFFGLKSPWTGLQNFRTVFFMHPTSRQVIINTVIIAVAKIIGFIVVPVAFALLLNEASSKLFRRSIQTAVYLPNFISWVIVGTVFRLIVFSPTGLINTTLLGIGILEKPIFFMTSNTWFRPIIVTTDIWKGFGYGAVIYISAITGIDLNLYEAADIDGASRWQKMFYITLPGIAPTVILLSTLSLGNVLNAGGDQILNMYNPAVYETGDVLDTLTYRIGLKDLKFHLATALGLARSAVSLVFIVLANWLAGKFANYRIF